MREINENIINYSEFELFVIEELKKYLNKKTSFWNQVWIFGITSTVGCYVLPTEGTSMPNLNAFLYHDFLEKSYKERFEEKKNDPTAVRRLINEAVEQIKQKINDRENS